MLRGRLSVVLALALTLAALATACSPVCTPAPTPPECSVTTNPEACRKAYSRCS